MSGESIVGGRYVSFIDLFKPCDTPFIILRPALPILPVQKLVLQQSKVMEEE